MTNDDLTWTPPKFPPHVKKVLVAGTRTFSDYDLLAKRLDVATFWFSDVVLVSGGAKGADRLAERWAYSKKYTVVQFIPDWTRHGKAAGPIRNQEMVDYVKDGGVAIFLWDGKSPGTKDCVERCQKAGVRHKVFRY